MELSFQKWHGCQNDFILFQLATYHGPMIVDTLIRKSSDFCQRFGGGIGADGVILIHPPSEAEAQRKITIINQDGTRALHCGNGLRCAATSLYRDHFVSKKRSEDPLEALELSIEGSPVLAQFLPSKNELTPFICLNMGRPTRDQENDWHDGVTNYFKDTQDILKLHTCTLGNRHAIIFAPEQRLSELMLSLGERMQSSELMREINLHVVSSEALEPTNSGAMTKILGSEVSESYTAFSWERGCGPTRGCGSGAAAISSIVLSDELTPRELWLQINMPGGALYTQQSEADAPVLLVGDAESVFEGTIDI